MMLKLFIPAEKPSSMAKKIAGLPPIRSISLGVEPETFLILEPNPAAG